MLEVNPRASRTVPFVSKAIGVPLAKLAALRDGRARRSRELGFTEEIWPRHFSVKEAVFPFVKFPGVDTLLGPEMKSTGEVMGIDSDFGRAFAKAQIQAGNTLPTRGTRARLGARARIAPRSAPVVRELADARLRGARDAGHRGRARGDRRRAPRACRRWAARRGELDTVGRIQAGDVRPRVQHRRQRSHARCATPRRSGARRCCAALPYFTTVAARARGRRRDPRAAARVDRRALAAGDPPGVLSRACSERSRANARCVDRSIGVGAVTQRERDPARALEPVRADGARARARGRRRGLAALARARRRDRGAARLLELRRSRRGWSPSASSASARAHAARRDRRAPDDALRARVRARSRRASAEVVLVTGGEAKHRASQFERAGAPAPITEQPGARARRGLAPGRRHPRARSSSRSHLGMPVRQYAVIENALRRAEGRSLEAHRNEVASLWAEMSRVAAENPDAWSREFVALDADPRRERGATACSRSRTRSCTTRSGTSTRRPGSIFTSAALARREGVPESQWIHPRAVAESNYMLPLVHRAELHRCAGVPDRGPARRRARVAAARASWRTSSSTPASRSPCACSSASSAFARELPVTVTGGMAFAGGPLNNFVLQAAVRLAQRAARRSPARRHAERRQRHAHEAGRVALVVARRARVRGARRERGGGARDARASRSAEGFAGTARVAGYTVLYDGRPAGPDGRCSCDTGDGRARGRGRRGSRARAGRRRRRELVRVRGRKSRSDGVHAGPLSGMAKRVEASPAEAAIEAVMRAAAKSRRDDRPSAFRTPSARSSRPPRAPRRGAVPRELRKALRDGARRVREAARRRSAARRAVERALARLAPFARARLRGARARAVAARARRARAAARRAARQARHAHRRGSALPAARRLRRPPLARAASARSRWARAPRSRRACSAAASRAGAAAAGRGGRMFEARGRRRDRHGRAQVVPRRRGARAHRAQGRAPARDGRRQALPLQQGDPAPGGRGARGAGRRGRAQPRAAERIVPRYATPEGVHPRALRRAVAQAVADYADLVPGRLPETLVARARAARRPRTRCARCTRPTLDADLDALAAAATPAHERLILEELYLLELGLALRRDEKQRAPGIAMRVDGPRAARGAARAAVRAHGRAAARLARDRAPTSRAPHPMSRLLEGDVGSGKTVIAYLAAVAVAESGHQTALMAPTELLAEQHYRTLRQLVGGTRRAARRAVHGVGAAAATPSASARELARGRDRRRGRHARAAPGHGGVPQPRARRRGRAAPLRRAPARGAARRGRRRRAAAHARDDGDADPAHARDDAARRSRPDRARRAAAGPAARDARCSRARARGARCCACCSETVARGEQAYVVYPLIEESEKSDLRAATESAQRIAAALPGRARRSRARPARRRRAPGRDGALRVRRDAGARVDDRGRGGRRRRERDAHDRRARGALRPRAAPPAARARRARAQARHVRARRARRERGQRGAPRGDARDARTASRSPTPICASAARASSSARASTAACPICASPTSCATATGSRWRARPRATTVRARSGPAPRPRAARRRARALGRVARALGGRVGCGRPAAFAHPTDLRSVGDPRHRRLLAHGVAHLGVEAVVLARRRAARVLLRDVGVALRRERDRCAPGSSGAPRASPSRTPRAPRAPSRRSGAGSSGSGDVRELLVARRDRVEQVGAARVEPPAELREEAEPRRHRRRARAPRRGRASPRARPARPARRRAPACSRGRRFSSRELVVHRRRRARACRRPAGSPRTCRRRSSRSAARSASSRRGRRTARC